MSSAYAPLSLSLAGWLWLARNPNKAGGEMFKRHFIFPIGRSSVSQSPLPPSVPRSHLSRPIYQTTTRISLLRMERFKSRARVHLIGSSFVILPLPPFNQCQVNYRDRLKNGPYSLACVKRAPAARGSQYVGITQPRDHSLADPCKLQGMHRRKCHI